MPNLKTKYFEVISITFVAGLMFSSIPDLFLISGLISYIAGLIASLVITISYAFIEEDRYLRSRMEIAETKNEK
ncbi:hypothetical protein ACFL24_00585 [Patescibacteria group bacterium]